MDSPVKSFQHGLSNTVCLPNTPKTMLSSETSRVGILADFFFGFLGGFFGFNCLLFFSLSMFEFVAGPGLTPGKGVSCPGDLVRQGRGHGSGRPFLDCFAGSSSAPREGVGLATEDDGYRSAGSRTRTGWMRKNQPVGSDGEGLAGGSWRTPRRGGGNKG